jgi:hypothetical protein
LRPAKLTFLGTHSQTGGTETIQNGLQRVHVGLKVLGNDDDIVQEDEHRGLQFRTEDSINDTLPRSGGTGQTERHALELVQATTRYSKGCILARLWRQSNLPESAFHVQRADVLGVA